MNIPQIDQDLATIKAIHIQVENGYHISKSDYSQLQEAIIRVLELKNKAHKTIKE